MKFTTAATVLTLSLVVTTDGATQCNQRGQEEYCNPGPGDGCTMVDPAFIHDNCMSPSYPEYFKEGDLIFGWGWYCNDGADVQDLTCDDAYIHTDCSSGTVTFDNGSWMCADSLEKDETDEDATINDANVVAVDNDIVSDGSVDDTEDVEQEQEVTAIDNSSNSAAASNVAVARIALSSVVVATIAAIM